MINHQAQLAMIPWPSASPSSTTETVPIFLDAQEVRKRRTSRPLDSIRRSRLIRMVTMVPSGYDREVGKKRMEQWESNAASVSKLPTQWPLIASPKASKELSPARDHELPRDSGLPCQQSQQPTSRQDRAPSIKSSSRTRAARRRQGSLQSVPAIALASANRRRKIQANVADKQAIPKAKSHKDSVVRHGASYLVSPLCRNRSTLLSGLPGLPSGNELSPLRSKPPVPAHVNEPGPADSGMFPVEYGARDDQTYASEPRKSFQAVVASGRSAFSSPHSRHGTVLVPPPRPRVITLPKNSISSSATAARFSTPSVRSSPSGYEKQSRTEAYPYSSPRKPAMTHSQSNYMEMLLSLDKIPRLHNILVVLFTWLLLLGFVVVTGAFTSPGRVEAGLTGVPTASPRHISRGLHTAVTTLGFACMGSGLAGALYLACRWRANYVWLLNKLYMPLVLHTLTGLLATLLIVYTHHGGKWNVQATVAVVIETVTLGAAASLFAVYNYWLLERVKDDHAHRREAQSRIRMSLRDRMNLMRREPPFAPGSVV